MSIIQKHNYEAFMLDYMEGNLSFKLTEELFEFLKQNPELDSIDNSLKLPYLESQDIPFLEKESLKKDSKELNAMEIRMIQEVEGSHSEIESKLLRNDISNQPMLIKELERFQKTILFGETIVFPGKEALKKENKFIIPVYYKAAAAFLLLVSMYFLLAPKNPNTISPAIAKMEQNKNIVLPLAVKNLKQNTPFKTTEIPYTPPKSLKAYKIAKKRTVLVANQTPKANQSIQIIKIQDKTKIEAQFKENIKEYSEAKLAQANPKPLKEKKEDIPLYEVKYKTLAEVIDQEVIQKVVKKNSTETYNNYSIKIGKFEMHTKRKRNNL